MLEKKIENEIKRSDFDVDSLDKIKNIKAELVRQKLLSRKDLMN